MKTSLRTILDLVRLPNLPTACADVLAGFLFAGGSLSDWTAWTPLALSSALLYAGGVTLNDVCDASRDALERPTRPIPSGQIAPRTATHLALLLLAAGVTIAFVVQPQCGLVAAAIVASIVAYDYLFKMTQAAPVLMGACRGLNLALGITAAGSLTARPALVVIAMFALYVASLTWFARREAAIDKSDRLRLQAATICCAAAFAALLALPALGPTVAAYSWIVIAAGIVIVSVTGFRAAAHPTPARVQQAVRTFILVIVWFDACIAWSGAGWAAGATVASLILPTLLLAKAFRVT